MDGFIRESILPVPCGCSARSSQIRIMYFIQPYRPSEQPPLGLVLPGSLQLRRPERPEERKAALPPDSTASKSPAAADLRQRQRWHFPPLSGWG